MNYSVAAFGTALCESYNSYSILLETYDTYISDELNEQLMVESIVSMCMEHGDEAEEYFINCLNEIENEEFNITEFATIITPYFMESLSEVEGFDQVLTEAEENSTTSVQPEVKPTTPKQQSRIGKWYSNSVLNPVHVGSLIKAKWGSALTNHAQNKEFKAGIKADDLNDKLNKFVVSGISKAYHGSQGRIKENEAKAKETNTKRPKSVKEAFGHLHNAIWSGLKIFRELKKGPPLERGSDGKLRVNQIFGHPTREYGTIGEPALLKSAYKGKKSILARAKEAIKIARAGHKIATAAKTYDKMKKQVTKSDARLAKIQTKNQTKGR